MPQLNQIIAIANGKKTRTKEVLTGLYHKIQKPDLFVGLNKTYQPDNEEGTKYPDEKQIVQETTNKIIEQAESVLTELLDITATQDYANCEARADIVVDEVVIVANVPVTHLLFLEKQLIDIATFISKLPTLDPSREWVFDANADYFKSEPRETLKTKKVMEKFVKAEATDKHPAQVEVFTVDVKEGKWTTINLSGAMPAKDKNEILERVRKLQDAVKMAREKANSTEIKPIKIASKIFDYILES